MLPSIAASSSGHWNHDGSRRWQRAIVPSPSRRSQPARRRGSLRPARGLRASRRAGARHRRGSAPSGRPRDDLLDQRHALLDLADAHPDAGIDVALLEHGHVERRAGRRADRRSAARIESAARGAADIAAGAELLRQRGLQDAGGDGAILQRGGVVVDLDQLREAAPDVVEQPAQAVDAASARSAATPPGTTRSIISRWPKQASRGAQRALAQDAAMRVHHRERGVVADRADVAEMVGEPFELRHQRAQIVRARRRLDVERRFDRAREGERIGDRAVAGGAAGEPRRLVERSRRSSAPRCPCAHSRAAASSRTTVSPLAVKRKWPGLDDAGMHRPDRDLVQALALGRQEWIGRRAPCARRRGRRADAARPRSRGRATAGCPARRSAARP